MFWRIEWNVLTRCENRPIIFFRSHRLLQKILFSMKRLCWISFMTQKWWFSFDFTRSLQLRFSLLLLILSPQRPKTIVFLNVGWPVICHFWIYLQLILGARLNTAIITLNFLFYRPPLKPTVFSTCPNHNLLFGIIKYLFVKHFLYTLCQFL
jgi:hypothetical protein